MCMAVCARVCARSINLNIEATRVVTSQRKNVHVVYLVRYVRFNSIGVHCNSVLHNVFTD